jgi:hypothetical protein
MFSIQLTSAEHFFKAYPGFIKMKSKGRNEARLLCNGFPLPPLLPIATINETHPTTHTARVW